MDSKRGSENRMTASMPEQEVLPAPGLKRAATTASGGVRVFFVFLARSLL
jgi:hypothetical protein